MEGKKLLCFLRRHVLPRAQTTTSSHQVIVLYREPGILTGYRLPGQSFRYYLASVFQIHNETVNIWTHFVGFFLVLYRWLTFLYDPPFDTRFLPVLNVFGFGSLCYTLGSTTAHTFHSKSPVIHYLCFQIDYAGNACYSLGFSIYMFYISCHIPFFDVLNRFYLPFMVMLSAISCLCCSIAKIKYARPYPFRRKIWNLLSFGTQTVLMFSLVVPRYLSCYYDPLCQLTSMNHHTYVVIFVLLSVFFYSSRLPDKLLLGKVDIVGQSHQLFHVSSVMGTLLQFDCIAWDSNHHATINMAPDPRSLLVAMISYLTLVICIICSFRPFILKRVEIDLKSTKEH